MIEKLMLFGLTRQEATIYICLYQNGAQNGYETAKLTGISRSNVYSALAGLVEKGAAYLMEGASNKYLAVAVDELCENQLRRLQEAKKDLETNLTAAGEETEGYITINGYRHIRDKIHAMLQKAKQRVYLSIPSRYVTAFTEEIQRLVDADIKVVILTDETYSFEKVQIYVSSRKEDQIHLIVDSMYVLTGDYSQQEGDTCLYSGQKNFVNVLKEALRNEIRLTQMEGNSK